MTTTIELLTSEVIQTAETQQRMTNSAEHIKVMGERITELAEQGKEIDPISVFMVNGQHVLVDGFHRLMAYIQEVDLAYIKAVIVGEGTMKDAIAYSFKANWNHAITLRLDSATKNHICSNAAQFIKSRKLANGGDELDITVSAKEITDLLGVEGQLKAANVAAAAFNKEAKAARDELIRQFIQAGMTTREIRDAVGCGESVIARIKVEMESAPELPEVKTEQESESVDNTSFEELLAPAAPIKHNLRNRETGDALPDLAARLIVDHTIKYASETSDLDEIAQALKVDATRQRKKDYKAAALRKVLIDLKAGMYDLEDIIDLM